MKADDLQQAVYTRLNDSSLTSLLSAAYTPLVPIFTDVPQAADSGADNMFPFVTIGADTITPFDDKSNLGGNAIVQVDIWARATSMLAIKAIADAVDARLRRQPLSISGATHITTELESSTPTRDPDGKTKRILSIYRVLYISV
jgi:hypothetical protein